MTGSGGRDVGRLLADVREHLAELSRRMDPVRDGALLLAALRLVDQLRALLSAGELVGPAGGVLRVRAGQVEPRDRLLGGLMGGGWFDQRPEVLAVRLIHRGVLVLLELDGVEDAAFLPSELVLVDRPAPVPPATPEAIADMAAAVGAQSGPEPEPEPSTVEDDPPAMAVSLAGSGALLDLPGGPVGDRERGRLWLPTSPRAWAGRFAREAGR